MPKTTLLFLMMLLACESKSKKGFIQNDYCIVNGRDNDMGLWFTSKKDTFFLFYFNVVDNGNYINGPLDDSTDFAGYFLVNQLKDSSVRMKIKNYRSVEDSYMVRLDFHDNGNYLVWEMDSGAYAYLPRRAKFESCALDSVGR